MSRSISRRLLVYIALASCAACTQSHARVGPDACSVRDAGPLDAAIVDAGDYIPGDPDARADLAVWQEYCIRMAPLVAGQSRSYAEVACVRDVRYDLSCMPTIREMNHCLDVARSLYDGTLLDITTVPACWNMCHADGG